LWARPRTEAALAAIRTLQPYVVLLDLFSPGMDGMAELAALIEETAWRHPPAARCGCSPQEVKVLREVVRGRPNRDIARTLPVSEETIKTHVSSILG
jgi:DNA-binding NarL/FixJ family response regulator